MIFKLTAERISTIIEEEIAQNPSFTTFVQHYTAINSTIFVNLKTKGKLFNIARIEVIDLETILMVSMYSKDNICVDTICINSSENLEKISIIISKLNFVNSAIMFITGGDSSKLQGFTGNSARSIVCGKHIIVQELNLNTYGVDFRVIRTLNTTRAREVFTVSVIGNCAQLSTCLNKIKDQVKELS